MIEDIEPYKRNWKFEVVSREEFVREKRRVSKAAAGGPSTDNHHSNYKDYKDS